MLAGTSRAAPAGGDRGAYPLVASNHFTEPVDFAMLPCCVAPVRTESRECVQKVDPGGGRLPQANGSRRPSLERAYLPAFAWDSCGVALSSLEKRETVDMRRVSITVLKPCDRVDQCASPTPEPGRARLVNASTTAGDLVSGFVVSGFAAGCSLWMVSIITVGD